MKTIYLQDHQKSSTIWETKGAMFRKWCQFNIWIYTRPWWDSTSTTTSRCLWHTLSKPFRSSLPPPSGSLMKKHWLMWRNSWISFSNARALSSQSIPLFRLQWKLSNVPLDYALFWLNNGVVDSKTNIHYDKVFLCPYWHRVVFLFYSMNIISTTIWYHCWKLIQLLSRMMYI